MQLRQKIRLAGAALLLLLAAPQPAVAEEVDLELVLAADNSGSMDMVEHRLQREGYAAAITSRDVLAAIRSGVLGRIALTFVEWAGVGSQVVVVDWTVIDGPEAARAFAERLLTTPRSPMIAGGNAIGDVIDFSLDLLNTNAHEGLRRTIDVSGDGPNIRGGPVAFARDRALAQGVTVNALVVDVRGGNRRGPGGMPLDEYFRRAVIGGIGAFTVVAEERATFAEAVRRKMVLEIAGRVPGEFERRDWALAGGRGTPIRKGWRFATAVPARAPGRRPIRHGRHPGSSHRGPAVPVRDAHRPACPACPHSCDSGGSDRRPCR